MTNYDMIQIMPRKNYARFLVTFAKNYKGQSESEISEWLTRKVHGEDDEWEDKPISELDLKPQVYEALYASGVRTLGNLVRYRAYDLLRIPHIGEKGLQQIMEEFERITGKKIKL